jgi:hypothetical protein
MGVRRSELYNLLDEVIFEHRSRIKQARLNKFIEQLNSYFEEKSDGKYNIDRDQLNTEEFSDVFEKILYSVSKTSAEHKIEIFKNILIKRIEAKNESIDFESNYIDITTSISELQFIILSHYASISDDDLYLPVKFEIGKYRRTSFKFPGYSAQDEWKKKRILYEKWKNIDDPNDSKTYSISSEEFLISVIDLISKGLLFDYSNRDEVLEQNKYFGISILGRKYIEYVVEKGTSYVK